MGSYALKVCERCILRLPHIYISIRVLINAPGCTYKCNPNTNSGEPPTLISGQLPCMRYANEQEENAAQESECEGGRVAVDYDGGIAWAAGRREVGIYVAACRC